LYVYNNTPSAVVRKGLLQNDQVLTERSRGFTRKQYTAVSDLIATDLFKYKNLILIAYLVCIFVLYCINRPIRSRGSSVSIVSGYGLDDRAIGVRSPAEAREFFL
jgi:hypothetical protein